MRYLLTVATLALLAQASMRAQTPDRQAALAGFDSRAKHYGDVALQIGGAASASVDRAGLFIDSVARAGGADLAAWVRRASSDPQPVLDLPDSWTAPAAARGARRAPSG